MLFLPALKLSVLRARINMRSAGTAVLFFTNTASKEAEGKLFLQADSGKVNERIAKLFIRHTEKEIQKSGLPYFKITSDQQQGNSFGERLTNAFLTVFASGYDHVIAVGNDCPELTAQLLRIAAGKLQRCQSVFGPAADGGTYLIGMSKYDFDAAAFMQVKWKTNAVYDELLNYCISRELGQYSFPVKADIDTVADIKTFHACTFFVFRFLQNIRLILRDTASVFLEYKFNLITARYTYSRLLRSPAFS